MREEVSTEVHRWRKEHFPRQLRAFKPTKVRRTAQPPAAKSGVVLQPHFLSNPSQEAHDKFVKAQKPWAKLIKQQKRCRKQFFMDSANFENAKKKLSGAKSGRSCLRASQSPAQLLRHVKLTMFHRPYFDADPAMTPEELAKLQSKRDKAEQAVADSRKVREPLKDQIRFDVRLERSTHPSPSLSFFLQLKAYEKSIEDLNRDRPRYEETMTKAFEYCQVSHCVSS